MFLWPLTYDVYDVYEQTTGTDRGARVHAVFHNTQNETI